MQRFFFFFPPQVLTLRASQPCVGQVLGDSFTEIESLGAPEHFCEDELLSILNSDRRSDQTVIHESFISFLFVIFYNTSIYKLSACICVSLQEELDLEVLCKENSLLPSPAEHPEEPEDLSGATSGTAVGSGRSELQCQCSILISAHLSKNEGTEHQVRTQDGFGA